jgi:hypothetical protein
VFSSSFFAADVGETIRPQEIEGEGVVLAGSSLIPFHRVLITTAIVLCAGLSWWMFSMRGRDDETPFVLLGVVFAILAVALGVYLWNLRKVLGYRDR